MTISNGDFTVLLEIKAAMKELSTTTSTQLAQRQLRNGAAVCVGSPGGCLSVNS